MRRCPGVVTVNSVSNMWLDRLSTVVLRSRRHRDGHSAHGCSTVVLIGFTCPAITVGSVILPISHRCTNKTGERMHDANALSHNGVPPWPCCPLPPLVTEEKEKLLLENSDIKEVRPRPQPLLASPFPSHPRATSATNDDHAVLSGTIHSLPPSKAPNCL